MRGIKRTAEDRRFSMMIRERDQFTCQRCGERYLPSSTGLHAAHCFTRAIKRTRHDPDNAAALCFGCHQFLDAHGDIKHEFFRELLGPERFEELRRRARTLKKRQPIEEGS